MENNDSLNELYEQFTPNLTHKRVHEIKKVFYKLGDVDGVSKSSHDLYVKNWFYTFIIYILLYAIF